MTTVAGFIPLLLAKNAPGSIWNFPLMPERASSVAGRVDLLYLALVAFTIFFTVLIATLLVFFAVKYRAGSKAHRGGIPTKTTKHELVWIGVPLCIEIVLFLWASQLFFTMSKPPKNTMDVYVVGKQWMWKIQHPGGKREINELHVPLNQPVKLIMTSQDVIHSFFVPAFRMKMDVLPGRYTTAWFEATKTGEYHLFCAEYCGADHARMIGKIVVMEPEDYQAWLGGSTGMAMTAEGGTPLAAFGCNQCHVPESDLRAPRLEGIFGKPVRLMDGKTVTADEEYLRESILNPQAKIVQGYTPIMPSYRGQLDAEQLMAVIEHIKSLAGQAQGEGGNKGEASMGLTPVGDRDQSPKPAAQPTGSGRSQE